MAKKYLHKNYEMRCNLKFDAICLGGRYLTACKNSTLVHNSKPSPASWPQRVRPTQSCMAVIAFWCVQTTHWARLFGAIATGINFVIIGHRVYLRWRKHTNSILEYFGCFCRMSSKLILITLSNPVSKLVRF